MRGSTVVRTLVALAATVSVLACAFGDIYNGPLPADVTADQIAGTWVGPSDPGTFEFTADGRVTATDLPADALPPEPATHRWSGAGTWRITSPIGGRPDQHNIVAFSLFGLTDPASFDPAHFDPARAATITTGGYGGQLSASTLDDVLTLSMGNLTFTKK